ncbi:MAG TPA: potassium transporter TrkG [Candidatus Sulfomarinibacteraceae bacterium]|nr:potassium transporter TrkG [Candidatus Sulfomarinibacteraceae bacterium]
MRLAEHLRRRYTAILKYTGLIWTIVGLLILSPLLALPFLWHERILAWGFLLPGLALAVAGFILWATLKPPDGLSLTVIEGTVIVVISWLMATAVGAMPFLLVGHLSLTPALFESTSGWTTTGLSVVDVTTAPRLILLYRSIMQLAGGAGFAIIVRATLTGPTGIGLTSAEGREEQLAPHVRRSASIVLTLYLGYVIFGMLALRFAGMEWFDAVNHSFAALSTGGFSTRAESIGFWDSPMVEAVVIGLMLLGTTNFVTSYKIFRGEFRNALRSTQLRFLWLLLLVFIPTVLLGVTVELYPQLNKAVRVAIFEVVSAASTTGFSTVGYTGWPSLGWLVLLALMLIGGGAGSTAGGIKQYRVMVLLRAMVWEVRRWFLPRRTVTTPAIWESGERRFLDDATIRKQSTFISLYLLIFLLGSILTAAHGYSLPESVFEFASTVGTVGLSVGVTAIDAPVSLLWTQIGGMILGRLEFFAFIVGLVKLLGDVPQLLRLPELETEIVFREGQLTPGRYLVLVPVAAERDAVALGKLGSLLAQGAVGQVLGLTVIKVPSLLNPLAGRVLLRERRPLVDTVVEEATGHDVPVQAMVRSSRDVSKSILRTIQKSGADLALFGWPRPVPGSEHAFSPVVDSIIADPPCDLAVLRFRPFDRLQTLLLPVSGSPNETLAADIATRLAQSSAGPATLRVVYVPPADFPEKDIEERAQEIFDEVRSHIRVPYETQTIRASSASNGVLRAAEDCDMIVIGATSEPLLRNLLLGNVAQTVAEKASCPVLVVKRRSTLLRSVLRETILKPVAHSSKLSTQGPPWPPS